MVEPQITIVKILADLNLAVRYGIAICKYEILAGFNLAIAKVDHQTAKFDTYCGFFPLSSESMDCKHTRCVYWNTVQFHPLQIVGFTIWSDFPITIINMPMFSLSLHRFMSRWCWYSVCLYPHTAHSLFLWPGPVWYDIQQHHYPSEAGLSHVSFSTDISVCFYCAGKGMPGTCTCTCTLYCFHSNNYDFNFCMLSLVTLRYTVHYEWSQNANFLC